jgi:Hemolysins and related proteins containing CBS domains
VSSTDWGYVAAIIVLIAATGFLAMAETALTRMSRVKALSLQEEGKRGAGTSSGSPSIRNAG